MQIETYSNEFFNLEEFNFSDSEVFVFNNCTFDTCCFRGVKAIFNFCKVKDSTFSLAKAHKHKTQFIDCDFIDESSQTEYNYLLTKGLNYGNLI